MTKAPRRSVARMKISRAHPMGPKNSLGDRIRELRKQRGMTLTQLAGLAKLSASNLSKIETGKISVNFETVNRFAEGLGVPIASLVAARAATPKLAGRRSITKKRRGRHFSNQRYDLEILCDDLVHKQNVFWRVVVKARTLQEYGEFSRHPGEEFIYMLSGSMVLHTDQYRPVVLGEGDSIFFDSSMGHAYLRHGAQPAVFLMSNSIGSDPVAGFEDVPGAEMFPAKRRSGRSTRQ